MILKNPEEISLDQHGVIEAHAGTGKTYTIIRMVLRMLEQTVTDKRRGTRFIQLREILLVTYTEKAAGELRKRIRDGIASRIEQYRESGRQDIVEHLESCLNNMHEALIGTIHSICLRILQTFPFETGVHFATEIVDDDEGLLLALRESMRTEWQEGKTAVPWALNQLEKKRVRINESHLSAVHKTAKCLLEEETAVLDRGAVGGLTLLGFRDAYGKLSEKLENCKEDFSNELSSLCGILRKIRSGRLIDSQRETLLDERLDHFQKMRESGEYDIRILLKPCKVGRKNLYLKSDLKKYPQLAELEIASNRLAEHSYVSFLQEKDVLLSKLPLAFICDTSELLACRYSRTKLERGLVSYNDMLRLTHKAVNKNESALLFSLRSRLRFGIIDEFQDTSVLQWQIFEKVFLENENSNGPKLFIVGDPKQSIYSFQGADVYSYLKAKQVIAQNRGKVYNLVGNYRSLPEMIRGYNAILGRDDESDGILGEDWFLFSGNEQEGIAYPSAGNAGKCAHAPQRENGPDFPLEYNPVQIMALEGNAGNRKQQIARNAGRAIRKMKCEVISVPEGPGWKNITLDYKDFAVIVETHSLADTFLQEFRNQGIPAVKYKMMGVFQSPMARDLHALLNAVVNREGDPAPRLGVLLTHFFNHHPAYIDSERALEPCELGESCSGDNLCIAHALLVWGELADNRKWAQLFRSVLERTGIRERLVKLTDGERHLADLRQVVDYCIEWLYQKGADLEQLTEHLGRLFNEEENAGQDKNLHQLATEKSSVKVLTMHASKGLEFPVVFVMTSGSKTSAKMPLCWIGSDGKKHVMPAVSIDKGTREMFPELDRANQQSLFQQSQERRRLLYVALTRPQAMLFVPMHLKEATEDGTNRKWGDRELPPYADNDLTPRLQKLLDENNCSEICCFEDCGWEPENGQKVHADSEKIGITPVVTEKDIPHLDLSELICRQTSYSQLSRNAKGDRDVDRSEEGESRNVTSSEHTSILPGGKETGDALHRTIEDLLGRENIRESLKCEEIKEVVRNYLQQNGVLKRNFPESDQIQAQAVNYAVKSISGAFNSEMDIPWKERVIIADLPKSDRIAEMEFLLSSVPHWVHGYMDLVFRIRNVNSEHHPFRYYVLDWKSDTLDTYNGETISRCIVERHYDLQAKIYCHALDVYLKDILGEQYDPEENLGGAIYVFLRGFYNADNENRAVWCRKADPHADRAFVQSCLHRQA
ncbi:MAG: UvrD-helicase domain-containing protein [Chitinispirillaceae bacterium]